MKNLRHVVSYPQLVARGPSLVGVYHVYQVCTKYKYAFWYTTLLCLSIT